MMESDSLTEADHETLNRAKNQRERRYRFYAVSSSTILALLGNWWHHDYIKLPKLKGLPDGYLVEAMYGDWQSESIHLKVYHPSFDPVCEMGVIPNFTPAEFEVVDLRQMKQEATHVL